MVNRPWGGSAVVPGRGGGMGRHPVGEVAARMRRCPCDGGIREGRTVAGSFNALAALLALVLSAWLAVSASAQATQTIRVGIYQNEPKIFLDDTGTPSGFFPELLSAIAADNGWQLVYVSCAWADCLTMLAGWLETQPPDVVRAAFERFATAKVTGGEKVH